VVVDGRAVYLGGFFDSVDFLPRANLAAVDTGTAVPTPWHPEVGGPVLCLAVNGTAVYAGGDFTSTAELPQTYLAAFSSQTTAVPAPPVVAVGTRLQGCWPNPFRSATEIRFTLAAAEDVTLSVFDLAGREVATLLRGERLGPGPHRVAFAGRALASGVYLCALRAGDARDTAKIVLAK
jgi:hypothetical protein